MTTQICTRRPVGLGSEALLVGALAVFAVGCVTAGVGAAAVMSRSDHGVNASRIALDRAAYSIETAGVVPVDQADFDAINAPGLGTVSYHVTATGWCAQESTNGTATVHIASSSLVAVRDLEGPCPA